MTDLFDHESQDANIGSAPPAGPLADSHTAQVTPPIDAATEREVRESTGGIGDTELTAATTAMPVPAEPTDLDILSGRIANVGSRDVLIDFGGKSLGAMPRSEFEPGETCAVGDPIEVMSVGEDARTGLLNVSRRKAQQAKLLRTLKVGDTVSGLVTGMNKGGLEVSLHGLRAFIPSSQVDAHFMKDISELIGQTTQADVTEFEPHGPTIVLSRRKWQTRAAAEERNKAFEAVRLGEVRRGRVRALVDYGAFVDIGGIDALLHVSDMSWGRINKPEEVLKVGDEVEVKVIKINREAHKISLSLKQAVGDPWKHVAERYTVGARVKGKVVRLQNFGAFIELEPGVDGLIPVSEMSWTKRVLNPGSVVKEGDEIEAVILSVDPAKKRLSLSLRQLTEDPWAVAAGKYAAGSMVKGKVVRLAEFGAFVALGDGIDGMIHISEVSEQRIKAVGDKLNVGQEVEARVLAIDPEAKKISLSLKPPPREPTPEERAAEEKKRQAAAKKREKHQSRRGGITIAWDSGLSSLDPSKFAR